MDDTERTVFIKNFYSTIELLREIKIYFGEINQELLKKSNEDRIKFIYIDSALKDRIIRWFDAYLDFSSPMDSESLMKLINEAKEIRQELSQ